MGTNWGVSESTICRIVTNIESTLMKTGKFGIPQKKALFKGFRHPEKDYNRALAPDRIVIEHINKSLKIFSHFVKSLSKSSPPLWFPL